MSLTKEDLEAIKLIREEANRALEDDVRDIYEMVGNIDKDVSKIAKKLAVKHRPLIDWKAHDR